eukprot:CAMPEP_0180650142 /NCGR_PEP_ID=MMETSP1037_2-20121125/52037_1 /TAXON_ID=632150 /ORGANISM="Azadinium spinosum, Strain 3D9" /LENGTH=68 /DNA_ID=CAMNT_0022675391 /DNA_START=335 /DNA_END=538 /DNA_ORIENTATION=-
MALARLNATSSDTPESSKAPTTLILGGEATGIGGNIIAQASDGRITLPACGRVIPASSAMKLFRDASL